MLGFLEDGTDALHEFGRPPRRRVGAGSAGQRRTCRDLSLAGLQEPGQCQGERRLSCSIRTYDAEGRCSPQREVHTSENLGSPLRPRHREVGRGQQDVSARAGQWALHRRFTTRHPDPGLAEGAAGGFPAEDVRRRAVGEDSAVGGKHHHTVDDACPHLHAVFDHHERRRVPVEHPDDGVAHVDDALRVEVGRGFVEQQQPRLHGKDRGERETLFLSAGQCGGGAVERHVQPDVVERAVDAFPDVSARNREVLRSERHLITNPRKDDLRIRILQHQPGTAALGSRTAAVEQECTLLLALVVVPQHPGQGGKERGLAGTGGTEEQDPLTGLDNEVDPPHREPGAARVPPPPVRGGDGNGCCRVLGHTSAVRPAAKEESTPVLASPRMASQESSPAITTPEMEAKST